MKSKFQARLIDDWPTEIVPAAKTLKCARDRCGAWTWWAVKGQRSLGYCLTCVPGAGFWQCSPEHETRVLLALLRAFPGSGVHQVDAAPTPAGYVGPDAGPCAGCHQPTRRYGHAGRPLCAGCEKARSPHA
jgi:hypothetical protein